MKHIISGVFLFAFPFIVRAGLSSFDASAQPSAPDYSKSENWSALPFRNDAADVVTSDEARLSDSSKQVDVFYIYPTIYTKGETWNADLKNQKLNQRIDNKPVRYQASAFNESCRVYAPRYRQAILESFYDSINGPKALAFAYEDVKHAFEYYLTHFNQGRPVIIASHSQGSYHARRLLREFFDESDNHPPLVAAYIIGYAVNRNMYTRLTPCEDPTQNNCYITWASYKSGFDPGTTKLAGDVCVNPLTWTTDSNVVNKDNAIGGILLSFKKVYPKATSASIHNHLLWVKTSLPIVRSWNNLHIADYNLFWKDIRANVKLRVQHFFASQ